MRVRLNRVLVTLAFLALFVSGMVQLAMAQSLPITLITVPGRPGVTVAPQSISLTVTGDVLAHTRSADRAFLGIWAGIPLTRHSTW